MSIVSALRTYLVAYSGLKTGAPLWVDYLGASPTEYSIVPLPGDKLIEQYLDGGSMREYHFALKTTASTADDKERLKTAEFYEAFSDWLDSQTISSVFPTLGTKKDPFRIQALGWGNIDEQGPSDTGMYSVICKLSYIQSA